MCTPNSNELFNYHAIRTFDRGSKAEAEASQPRSGGGEGEGEAAR
jgi:hypothetical protein